MPVVVIPLLMTLQRRAVECNTERLQLGEIKHADNLDVCEDRELSRSKGCKVLRSLNALNSKLHLVRSLQHVSLNRSSHICRASAGDGCKDSFVCCWCQLALAVAQEGEGAFNSLPKADGI